MRSPRISIVLTGVGRLLPLVIICCGVPSLARAQSALSGIVHDPTSRVAVGATVVIDDNMGGRWEGISNNIGYYEIHLPPGEYNVEAYLDLDSGQQLSYIGGVLVLPNENKGLDINLEYRNTEKVTVESAPLPATPLASNTALGITLTRDDIQKLPLPNGRTLQSFLSLVPGIVVTDSNGTLAQFTAAGQRRFANRLTIDGMSADLGIEIIGPGIGEAGSGTLPALSTIGSTQTLVPLAAIDEIKIQTTDATPEIARAPGAQMVVVTRSGANTFTGSAFTDWRPNGLSASDWFINDGQMPLRKTTFWNNGASAGGPVLKNRLFYFASWEREQIDRGITSTIDVPATTVREAAAARGDLSPVALAMLNAYPVPTSSVVSTKGLTKGLSERTQVFPANSGLDALSARLDANLADQHRLFFRFNGGSSSGDEINPELEVPRMSFIHTESTSTKTATIGLNSVLSSRMSNELKANVSANSGAVIGTTAPYGSANPLPVDVLAPGSSASDAWVMIKLFNAPGNVLLSGRTSGSTLSQIEFADTLSYVRGRHSLRFGVDYRRVTMSTDAARNRYTYSYPSLAAFLAQTDIQPTSVATYAPAKARFDSFSAFAQDTFRVGQRLSVDYGVRYELKPAPTSATGLEPLLINYEALPTIEFLQEGTPLWKAGWGNLAPQVGATYQLRTTPHFETNLRAGWSLTFDELASAGATPFGAGYPYDRANTGDLSNAGLTNGLTESLSTPFDGTDQSQYYAFAKNFRTPRTYSWNVGIDQALGATQQLGVAYVGTAGRNLVYREGYYKAGQQLPQINAYSSRATSDYDGLLVEYVRRFSHGFQSRLAYTWSHAIDIDSGEAIPQRTPNPPTALSDLSPSTNRGSADFDRRHVLQLTGTYHVPTPRMASWLQAMCNDWQIDGVVTLRSGTPFSPLILGRDFGFGFYDVRPDPVAGVPVWIVDGSVPSGRRFNPDAFAMSSEGQGALGRNTLRASPLRQVDLSISRSIRIGEHRMVQLRLDAFNAFNLANFGPPEARSFYSPFGPPVEYPNFGQPTHSYADALGSGTLQYGGLTPIQQLGGPRSIQIGLRFNF